MKEVWKIYPFSVKRTYKVSNKGRVAVLRYGEWVLLATRLSEQGYVRVGIYRYPTKSSKFNDNYAVYALKERLTSVHKLVLETFVGKRKKGQVCRHLDGTRNNNALPNLVWGTVQENANDMILHGTVMHGEISGVSKLTNKQAKEIFQQSGMYNTEIAKKYKIDPTTVLMVRLRRSYRAATRGLKLGQPKDAVLGRTGSNASFSKLSESDVRYIRKSNKTNAELARKFSVCRPVISNVRLGKSYENVV